MWFYQRNLPPIEIDEFAAGVALEAIEWHLGYLADRMRETRDKVDRLGWATARTQRFVLDDLRRRIRGHLKDMGPPPHMAAAEVQTRIRSYSTGLPQSDANAAVLRAEREARAKALAERKKGRGWDREASRRMSGGKWARPRITISGPDLDLPDDEEL
ncbi:hypothetical protein [Methylorubrum thiocyanatum]|uniref:hypothetical protein n=1 Tax=Methylorubrum thiocyanatum TaxID=47958 RepID=UPI0035C7E66C